MRSTTVLGLGFSVLLPVTTALQVRRENRASEADRRQEPVSGFQLLASGAAPHSASQCLAAAANADGARVALATCVELEITFPTGNFTWVVPPAGTAGQIKTFDGTKCLDVSNGDSSNGNVLQIWTCTDGNTNQLWKLEGPEDSAFRPISWASQDKCIDVKGGSFTSGNELQIWDCDSTNQNQWWWVTHTISQ
ncbi:hypothetical protein V5O48_011090 [Marasmius crinis-equi]|uniref:Ricin B lectin domain-containing protein n=1 Tax=Marasmius crinis-equi TaxID=585013 RepID=A0ABR3F6X2_9AGAR